MSADTDERTDLIRGLRELADFLEARPEVPVQGCLSTTVDAFAVDDEDKLGQMRKVARAMGSARKRSLPSHMILTKDFSGNVRYEFNAEREQVCKRIITGVEHVEIEEPDPKAVAALPKVKRTEKREIVEWECPSLLADEAEIA